MGVQKYNTAWAAEGTPVCTTLLGLHLWVFWDAVRGVCAPLKAGRENLPVSASTAEYLPSCCCCCCCWRISLDLLHYTGSCSVLHAHASRLSLAAPFLFTTMLLCTWTISHPSSKFSHQWQKTQRCRSSYSSHRPPLLTPYLCKHLASFLGRDRNREKHSQIIHGGTSMDCSSLGCNCINEFH